MSSFLVKKAPVTVKVGDTQYPIHADFRTGIDFEQMVLDPEIPDNLKSALAIKMYFGSIPANAKDALEAILWFYGAGKDSQENNKQGSSQYARQIYSFEYDAAYIFAAFYADYGIDLEAIEFLHWWKFIALFTALKPDNMICKIMEWRAADLGKLKGEERTFIRKMQQLYKLPVHRAETEKFDDINRTLMEGGDISALLKGE